MFRRIYRQRRRLLLGAFFFALAFFATLSRDPDLTQGVLPWAVPLILGVISLALGIAFLLVGILVVLLIPDWRGNIELVALTLLTDALLAFAFPGHFGLDGTSGYGYLTWFAIFFVIYCLIYGTWLDRFRFWLGYRARSRFLTPLSPQALWQRMVLGEAPLSQYYDPLLSETIRDPDDPDSFEVTYRLGHSVFEHQHITYLERLPEKGFRYYFQGEADPANLSLTEGTFDVRFQPRPDGRTAVTMTEDRPAMLPRLALSMWLDDVLGDRCDSLGAVQGQRHDWSLSGRLRRQIAKLA